MKRAATHKRDSARRQAAQRPPLVRGRTPLQDRSRERQRQILGAAEQLIRQGGLGALKMRDVALTAGVPTGSLYQYFPDRAALLLAMAQETLGTLRRQFASHWVEVRTMQDVRTALENSIDAYFKSFAENSVIRDIWAGTMGDARLMALDHEDSRGNAEALFRNISPILRPSRPERLQTACLLIMDWGASTVRLAINMQRSEARAALALYKQSAWHLLASP